MDDSRRVGSCNRCSTLINKPLHYSNGQLATQISKAYGKKGTKKAIETISVISQQLEGSLKEQSLLTLALLQEENGDIAGAKTSIDTLLQLNQNSDFIVASNDLVERLTKRSLQVGTTQSPKEDKTEEIKQKIKQKKIQEDKTRR